MSLHPPLGEARGGLHWGAVLAGLVASFAVSLVLAGLVALVIYATTITEQGASAFLFGFGLLSVALGAGYGAHRARGLGWAHGAAVGLGYVLVALLLQPLLFAGSWSLGGTAARLLWGALAGALGGVLGVNL